MASITDLNRDAIGIQRGKPCAFFGGRIHAGQGDDGQRVFIVGSRAGQLLDGGAAVFAGLAGGMRNFDQLLSANRLSEPPAASTLLQSKCAPCTVCTLRSEVASSTCSSADGIRCSQFVRLAAGAGQASAVNLLQVCGQLVQSQLHAVLISRRRMSGCQTAQ